MFLIENFTEKIAFDDEKHARFWAVINEGDGTKEWLNPVEVGIHKCN